MTNPIKDELDGLIATLNELLLEYDPARSTSSFWAIRLTKTNGYKAYFKPCPNVTYDAEYLRERIENQKKSNVMMQNERAKCEQYVKIEQRILSVISKEEWELVKEFLYGY